MIIGPSSKYGEIVPMQIGSFIMDKIVILIISQEIGNFLETWKQAHASTILSKSLNFRQGEDGPQFR